MESDGEEVDDRKDANLFWYVLLLLFLLCDEL